MRNKVLVCSLAAVMLATAACGPGTTTSTTNTKPAASPASTAAAQAASPASSAATSATANQDFTLINQTGVEIDKVFISPHSSNDWEEDILGRDTLPSGESVDIKFHRAEKAPLWDLRVEDKQGHSIEWENLNLLEINKLTLEYKDSKATAKID